MNQSNNIPDYLKIQIKQLDQRILDTEKLLNDPDMGTLAQEELDHLKKEKQELINTSSKKSSSPKQNQTNTSYNNCILEVRGAAGGEEAKIWAKDLLRMYLRFVNDKGYKAEQIDDMVLRIKGKSAYEKLKYESGVHRVQRIPATEKNGRIHTSTASVAILPVIPPSAIQIKEDELSWHFSRAGGHGGQNVNKVSTAVELTHKPTETIVKCRQERSQQQNREIALEMLRSQLWQQQEEKRLSKIESERKEAVGRGMRAEKIRTYNYPQNRVTDHRIKKNFRLEDIIEGRLKKMILTLKQEL